MYKIDASSARPVALVGALVLALTAGAVRAEDASGDKAKAGGAAKSTAKPLCDGDWDGGFWTIEVDHLKNDGRTPVSKPYDPADPKQPWFAAQGTYFRMGYLQDPDRRNKGLPPSEIIKMIGRFSDKKDADLFYKSAYKDSALARHFNPRYPPFVSAPGALLVSDKYTCTLSKENDAIANADWIVEVDGRLFAGAESGCKQGKTKKTVNIVDCDGKKVLATDTWASPCEGSRVTTCLFPMSPGVVAVQQSYSASGEGRQVSFRGYDLAKGRKIFAFSEGYDPTGYDDVTDFEDVDGDGIPELSGRHCEGDNCHRTRLQKWNGKRFVDVKLAK